ncbi:4880_t:CDS:2 [Entrophospora sp. SA101]|nr:4880_t:CDS:2 [Entrophospora sp. SA101]
MLYEREAAKDLDEDETIFNIEEELAKTTYLWQDKYRPRKPRYFNRVHTGYEWNKYNQTHYDSDNPPPKVVQGYKFNIFYPDLINKTKAPTYKIEREPGNTDTVLIRFIAGPPYEDIAFRIVNREWEYSHKKGFKSSFDRGVLQLHFHFKRHYYRR